MYCVGRDITSLREQQNALNRREKQLTQAESIGHMGHWNWTLGQDDIDWSEELFNIFGVEKKLFRPTLESMNRLVHKSGCNRRINAAGQAADDISGRADYLTDLFDLFLNKLSRCPIAFAAANVE